MSRNLFASQAASDGRSNEARASSTLLPVEVLSKFEVLGSEACGQLGARLFARNLSKPSLLRGKGSANREIYERETSKKPFRVCCESHLVTFDKNSTARCQSHLPAPRSSRLELDDGVSRLTHRHSSWLASKSELIRLLELSVLSACHSNVVSRTIANSPPRSEN